MYIIIRPEMITRAYSKKIWSIPSIEEPEVKLHETKLLLPVLPVDTENRN